KKAVALTGLRPELRCDRAFGLHVFEHRTCEAEAEFLRALTQNPALPSAYVRLGLLYGATGRFDEALDTLERGARVDPLLPTLAAAEVLVHCCGATLRRPSPSVPAARSCTRTCKRFASTTR